MQKYALSPKICLFCQNFYPDAPKKKEYFYTLKTNKNEKITFSAKPSINF